MAIEKIKDIIYIKGKVPKHENWVKYCVAGIGCYMIYRALVSGPLYQIIIGIVIICCVFFEKQMIISDLGVDVVHKMFGVPFHNMWTWQDVTTIHTDYRKAAPDAMVHVGRDVVTRTYTFTYEESQIVLELAREKNPDIYIDDMTPEREKELAENAKKRREQDQAEKEKKRAQKKSRR